MDYELTPYGKFKKYLVDNFEQTFVLLSLISVVLLSYFIPNKLAFLNFFFLPVVVAGYFSGIRLSVSGAFFCVLLVTMYVVMDPKSFAMPLGSDYLYLHLLAWGCFMVIVGYVVGGQRDKLKEKIRHTEELNRLLIYTNIQLRNTKALTIFGLAKLTEYRDNDTGAHLERIQSYCRILSVDLSTHPEFKKDISLAYIEHICLSSVLHDIGKVGIPDSILRKPGKLNEEEYEEMKVHTTLGGDTIRAIEERLKERSFLTLGREVAYCHHERWDGSGYPAGMKGEDIPLSARILAVADVYDALTSKRCYQEPISHGEAVAFIESKSGKIFDPRVVKSFINCEVKFDQVRAQLQGGLLPEGMLNFTIDKEIALLEEVQGAPLVLSSEPTE